MDAKKCDRCGALYDPVKKDYLFFVTKCNHPYPDTVVDLCYNCSYDLEEWLKEKKE